MRGMGTCLTVVSVVRRPGWRAVCFQYWSSAGWVTAISGSCSSLLCCENSWGSVSFCSTRCLGRCGQRCHAFDSWTVLLSWVGLGATTGQRALEIILFEMSISFPTCRMKTRLHLISRSPSVQSHGLSNCNSAPPPPLLEREACHTTPRATGLHPACAATGEKATPLQASVSYSVFIPFLFRHSPHFVALAGLELVR